MRLKSARVQHHGVAFWIYPVFIALIVACAVYFGAPLLKNKLDHFLTLLMFVFK